MPRVPRSLQELLQGAHAERWHAIVLEMVGICMVLIFAILLYTERWKPVIKHRHRPGDGVSAVGVIVLTLTMVRVGLGFGGCATSRCQRSKMFASLFLCITSAAMLMLYMVIVVMMVLDCLHTTSAFADAIFLWAMRPLALILHCCFHISFLIAFADDHMNPQSDTQGAPLGLASSGRVAIMERFMCRTVVVEEAGAACVICLLDYKAGDTLLELHCGHSFHKECILRWLQVDGKVCPFRCSHLSLVESPCPMGSEDSLFEMEIDP